MSSLSISTVGLFFIPLFVKINNMEQQTDVFIPDGMNAFQRNVKRVGDCLIAFVALIVFSPLFLYCYLAVKREDGGQLFSSRNESAVSGNLFIFISLEVCD